MRINTLVAVPFFGTILLVGAVADVQAREPSKPIAALLVVPAGSPVRLRSLNEHDSTAKFSGRFLLSGEFSFGCTDECTKPFLPKDMRLDFAPDPELAARLPHWREYTAPPIITIDNSVAFAAKVIPRPTMHRLQYGRLERVTGRTAIIVDRFHADIACDHAEYSARFVALARPGSVNRARVAGEHGCD